MLMSSHDWLEAHLTKVDYGKICGGVGDGSVRHEGIEDEASMQELQGKAWKTVFTYNAEDYKT